MPLMIISHRNYSLTFIDFGAHNFTINTGNYCFIAVYLSVILEHIV